MERKRSSRGDSDRVSLHSPEPWVWFRVSSLRWASAASTIALASKDIVSNIFGSLVIIADTPFRIGGLDRTGDIERDCRKIGFRSTKVRTIRSQTLVSVPNFAIANQTVNNFSTRDRRRITSFWASTMPHRGGRS
ncbi:MAG: mechanosensitive ion channel family protein [Desulfobacterales bacterium]|nr:mechanosensitive ion channel family protein [Desulfobacterales bacterium]